VPELPTGTVTFLFTDLVSSTRLWEEQPEEAMRHALDRHDAILRDAVDRHRGVLFSTMGDGIAAAFPSAPDAVCAALVAQRAMSAEAWGESGPLLARMGLHTDEGRLRAPDQYVNKPLNRCARLMAVAHGGQILVSSATEAVARSEAPEGARFVDLGEHRLRDVSEPMRVFQLVHPDLRASFPPLRSLDHATGNLPRQVTTLVGRGREVPAVVALVRSRPLVTLVGVGGVGKTRLALQVATEVAHEFTDGAWLCELAPVTEPDALWETIATSLGIQRVPGRSFEDATLEYLAPKRMLLVLDNCEHLVDAVARAVVDIAQHCPEVAILATSREGLAVAGEQIVAVPPLQLPPTDADLDALAHTDAVHLFVDRAHDVNADFALTDRNSADVAQLCRRLDGIPLAIELAAARVRSLPPEELVNRLDQRFRLLTRGSRAALERHQTLRNTIDWSYDLLSEPERHALNRLSVFAGGWDLDAAEAVVECPHVDVADVPEVLSQLVDKSLVVVDDTPTGARYRLLETIRQYAQERLEASGDTAAVRRCHAEHYVRIAEDAGPHLRSREQLEHAIGLARDTDNLRTALEWAVETGSAEHALRLVAPLNVSGLPVGATAAAWADIALAIPGADDHDLFPVVSGYAAYRAMQENDLDRLARLAAQARDASGPDPERHEPPVLMACALMALASGDDDGVRTHSERWLATARRRGDAYETARALVLLGAAQSNDPDAAIASLEESVRVARTSGVATNLPYALMMLALTLPEREAARSITLLEEATEANNLLGDQHGVAQVESFRGLIAARVQDWRTALEASASAAERFYRLGDRAPFGNAFWNAAFGLIGLGRPEPAAVLFGVADAHFGRPHGDDFARILGGHEQALAETLGDAELDRLRERGAALDVNDAVAYLTREAEAALGRAAAQSSRTRSA
jgi:predicted ATPase/class 3 adenylate cyclase